MKLKAAYTLEYSPRMIMHLPCSAQICTRRAQRIRMPRLLVLQSDHGIRYVIGVVGFWRQLSPNNMSRLFSTTRDELWLIFHTVRHYALPPTGSNVYAA